ncbi:hypothetical protein [Kaarinaea lacus]
MSIDEKGDNFSIFRDIEFVLYNQDDKKQIPLQVSLMITGMVKHLLRKWKTNTENCGN